MCDNFENILNTRSPKEMVVEIHLNHFSFFNLSGRKNGCLVRQVVLNWWSIIYRQETKFEQVELWIFMIIEKLERP